MHRSCTGPFVRCPLSIVHSKHSNSVLTVDKLAHDSSNVPVRLLLDRSMSSSCNNQFLRQGVLRLVLQCVALLVNRGAFNNAQELCVRLFVHSDYMHW